MRGWVERSENGCDDGGNPAGKRRQGRGKGIQVRKGGQSGRWVGMLRMSVDVLTDKGEGGRKEGAGQ